VFQAAIFDRQSSAAPSVAGAQQLDLPDGFFTGAGVGPAERHFAHAGVVHRQIERAQVALPGFEIGEVGAVGRRHRIAGVEDDDAGDAGRRDADRRQRQQRSAGRQDRRGGVGQIGLVGDGGGGRVFAEQAIDVEAPGRDGQIGAGRRQAETGVVDGHGDRAEAVACLDLDTMIEDVLLLVEIGVELHAALLHPHAAVASGLVEGGAAEVGFHCVSPGFCLGMLNGAN
jgi:hypothetical protein